MGDWSSFLVAQVGASAALASLVFVGVSINLANIIAQASLPERALEAVVLLTTMLVESVLLLTPGQTAAMQGAEVLAMGVVAWFIQVAVNRAAWRAIDRRF